MHEVVYFDFPPRADVLRILLHAGGIEFKDTRLSFPEWGPIKHTTPLGSLPVLKIDDEQFCQSASLARYCAKLTGFYPSDPLEALVVDEAMDTISEMMSKVPPGKDDDEKKAKREEYQAGFLTTAAKLLEARINKYGAGKGFVSSPSVADIYLVGVIQFFETGFYDFINPKFFDAYPGIKATVEAVSQNEKVIAYYKSIKKVE